MLPTNAFSYKFYTAKQLNRLFDLWFNIPCFSLARACLQHRALWISQSHKTQVKLLALYLSGFGSAVCLPKSFFVASKDAAMTMTRLSSSTIKSRHAPLFAAVLTLALSACGDKHAPAGAPPIPEVGVMTVEPGTVSLGTGLPGRLEASRVAEVRARAAGILLKRHFREGSEVKAGQTLFTIDAGPYRAAYNSARANEAQASALARRYRPLVAANAISKQEYDAAEAAATAARAQLETARINLGYTQVTAPISGRIGRELVTEGALVGQGQFTHLATIQQTDPMYINLTQSADDVMRLRQALQAGQMSRAAGEEAARVEIVLENGQLYEHAGRLLFTDLTVDPATGQVSLRAEVSNPQGLLLPGMYVRVRIQQAQVENAVLVPQQAVTRSANGDTVMVVAADGTFAPRPIKISQSQGHDWVVVDGLKSGERVMVDGFTRLRPGMTKVKAVAVAKNAASAASAPAAASVANASVNAAPAAAASAQASAALAHASAASASGAAKPSASAAASK